ncbi:MULTISPECIES: hypothetical protein [Jannaschia]|nr:MULTISPECIES: hypothetical protein [unclassified Jannaschia]
MLSILCVVLLLGLLSVWGVILPARAGLRLAAAHVRFQCGF